MLSFTLSALNYFHHDLMFTIRNGNTKRERNYSDWHQHWRQNKCLRENMEWHKGTKYRDQISKSKCRMIERYRKKNFFFNLTWKESLWRLENIFSDFYPRKKREKGDIENRSLPFRSCVQHITTKSWKIYQIKCR